MTIDPEDEKVAAAFASLKAESSAQFPPPPVNELLGRGPAVLRRRRLVSLAAVVGACTAVTAGGFAVAQTLGPLAGGPDPAETSTAAPGTDKPDDDPSRLGDPASPQVGDADDQSPTATPDGGPVIVIDPADWWANLPDAWGDNCGFDPHAFDAETWTITDDSYWQIVDPAPDPETAPSNGYVHDYGRPLDLDADGEKDDVLLELGCDSLATGVAAFTWDETGTNLHMLGWVWEPEDDLGSVDIQLVEDGVITLGGYSDERPETWQTRFVWDAENGAFKTLEADATAEPTPETSPSSPAPVETPTDEATTTTAPSGS